MAKLKGKNKIDYSHELDAIHQNHIAKLIAEVNKSKFDADVTGDKITPFIKDGDFVQFPFRHLSATIVGAGSWKAADFSNEKVLKEAMTLLSGRPSYLNHDLCVGNEIGYVGATKWSNSYVNADGIEIPAGIDGPIVIDSVLYPDLVRKMSAPVPYVKSSSVTVLFEWEASHEFEDPNDFYWHMGDMVEGHMVRRIVTKIIEFYESSLVWLGADPYAGILDENGKVKFVDRAGIVEISEYAKDIEKKAWKEDAKFFAQVCFGKNKNLSSHNQKIENLTKDTMKPWMLLLATKLGITNPTEDMFTEDVLNSFEFAKSDEFAKLKADAEKAKELESLTSVKDELVTVKAEVVTLKSDKTKLESDLATLKTEKTSLEGKVSSLQSKADVADSIITKRSEYAIEMYTKSVNGKVDDLILNEIKAETSLEKLESKIKLFGGNALSSFGAKCTKCDSSEITFRSSLEDTEDDAGKEKLKNNSFSLADRVVFGK